VPFDIQLIEAQLALGMIDPSKMPALAWDALEAGVDGKSIRRLAALNNPSGWEADQVLPRFMVEAGMKSISLEEASTRVARQLAGRILAEGLDPLAYSRDFELLWIGSDYSTDIQEVGWLDDQKAIGEPEADLRQDARNLLTALIATGPSNP
jgi:hypothetical protein